MLSDKMPGKKSDLVKACDETPVRSEQAGMRTSLPRILTDESDLGKHELKRNAVWKAGTRL